MIFTGVDDRAPAGEFLEAMLHGVLDLSLHFARHLYRVVLIPVLQIRSKGRGRQQRFCYRCLWPVRSRAVLCHQSVSSSSRVS